MMLKGIVMIKVLKIIFLLIVIRNIVFRYYWKDCGYKIWYFEEIYCSWKLL